MPDLKVTADRILVCVGSSPSSEGVIRYAAKRAAEMHARLYAVYVETPGGLLMTEKERARAIHHLRLAEHLGAETVTLTGRNIGEEIVRFALEKGITKIIAGK